LARAVPDDYLELWATLLAGAKETATGATTPYLAFRVGRSWMALRAVLLREIRQPSVIRSIPHRRHDVLLGVTAVRGDLYPCVSLHSLIGEAPPDISIPAVRFLVVLDRGGDWVVPVDEVSGVYDVIDSSMEHLPATLAHTGSVYTKGIAECGGRPVGLVEEQLLFSALHRRVG
jgi:chemotaxis signal transduction protein